MIAPPIALASALACFSCVAIEGVYVSTRLPPAIDRAGMRLRGHGTALAAFFTALGRTWAIVALTLVAAVAAISLGHSSANVLVLFAVQVLSQGAVALIKTIVRRNRPALWLLRLEGDSSFPSGHATTSVVFFIGSIPLVVGWHVGSVATIAVCTALGICAAGIAWSRLVLAAHYVTDVAGGLLFGTGWLLAASALLPSYR